MKRVLLVSYALALALFFRYGFGQWQLSGHSLTDAWQALRQDWLVFITFIDAAQFSLIVLIWLIFDLRRQERPIWEKLAWFGLTLWLGTPGLLLYVALRRQTTPRNA
jgi:hypothetical protein